MEDDTYTFFDLRFVSLPVPPSFLKAQVAYQLAETPKSRRQPHPRVYPLNHPVLVEWRKPTISVHNVLRSTRSLISSVPALPWLHLLSLRPAEGERKARVSLLSSAYRLVKTKDTAAHVMEVASPLLKLERKTTERRWWMKTMWSALGLHPGRQTYSVSVLSVHCS
ncbi:hypothetical protein BDQ17DRAFT_619678 [Cyathus striatus]|nr:hypothetical protein BDQ17DRAFT_619678 [Cyathus striatus]